MPTQLPPLNELTVPFVDLSRINGPVKDRVLAEIGDLIESGRFINGPQVEQFEHEFAAYCGVEHCVGVSSGLDAIRLALLAVDIEARR